MTAIPPTDRPAPSITADTQEAPKSSTLPLFVKHPKEAFLIIVSGYTAINAVVKAELFPAHIRALGVASPYAITNAAFGGTTEYVAL